jgi:Tfp pilus assembly protein PilF
MRRATLFLAALPLLFALSRPPTAAARGMRPTPPPKFTPSAAALPAYLDGLDALAAGKYAAAADAFSKVIDADEENPAGHLARGVARTLNQQFREAAADFRRANRLAGSRADWEYRGWGTIADILAGDLQSSFAPGIAPSVDRDYALALSEMQSTYISSLRTGSYWDRKTNKEVKTAGPYTGEFARVAQFFVERHRAVTGNASRLMLTRVQTRMKDGDYRGALDTLRPLLAASPDDPALLLAQAQALLALGDYATARRLFTQVLVVQPHSTETLAGRAVAAALGGDAVRVSRDLQLLRRLDARAAADAEQKVSRALLAAHATGNPQSLWSTLEADARRGVAPAQLAATAQSLVYALAPLRQRNDERYQDRRNTLEEALQAAPDDPDRMIALARFLFDETSLLYEHIEPRSDPVWYRTQSEAARRGDLKTIEDLVGRALARDPNHLGALTLKAHLLFDANQFADSEALVRQALKIKADDPQLLDLLANLLYVAAARRAAAATDLRTIRQWSERRFDTYPPTDWLYTRAPSAEELARAEALDREAQRLTEFAQEQIAKAAKAAAGTPMGFFLGANLSRLRRDLPAAREGMMQAVKLDPSYEKAWFQLAGINTELHLGDEATLARSRALNITQTTAAPWLVAAWFKIPRTQFKTARENLVQAITFDPADPRIPAYLGVIDAASDKPADAFAHFRMAVALADVRLRAHGWTVPPPATLAPLDAAELALPIILRTRAGAMALVQNRPDLAEVDFRTALALAATFSEDAAKTPIPAALLPNPELPEGVVPLAETPASLRIRAQAGLDYAAWARNRSPEDAALAGRTYNRLVASHTLQFENLDPLQGLAALGLAQLYMKSGEPDKAGAALKGGHGVPQPFFQELRQLQTTLEARADRRREAEANAADAEFERQYRRQAPGNAPGSIPNQAAADAAARAQIRATYQGQLNALDAQLHDPSLSPARRQAIQGMRDRLAAELQGLDQ